MEIKTIAVMGGAGQMGNGITQVAAASGFDVIAVDVAQEALERGRGRIEKSLGKLVKGGHLDEAGAAETMERISFSTDLSESGSACDYAIETVPEVLEIKHDVLKRIDDAAGEDLVIASNTSQFSISKLASATGRP